jgi:parallel beta-helix repeat protein
MASTQRSPAKRLRRLALGALAAAALALGATAVLPSQALGGLVVALTQHTPGDWVRHALRRLQGHPQLQALAAPPLQLLQRQLEREVPTLLPHLGKGQQPQPLVPQRYAEAGQPLPLALAAPAAGEGTGAVALHSEAEIAAALQQARPGQRLVIAPGRYRLTRPLRTGAGGTALAPIVLQAARPGEVTLEVEAAEGLVVAHPFWVVENLALRGVCAQHGDCEHGIHVVGAARSTVLRNNLLEDFNAHVKVNGLGGRWPDDGLLQFNTLRNGAPRQTHKPVTPVDIVAADGWRVADNLVADFVKAQGDGISYGVFMKGGGHGGRIERNLVICTTQEVSQPGVRAGLSFGGGGTRPVYCRDGRCELEHAGGTLVHNVVAHCNDAGIYVFRSSATTVAYNTLVNTAGVEVRVAPAQARVQANVLEGWVHARQGGVLQAADNLVGRLDAQAGELLLQPAAALAPTEAAPPGAQGDFCGRARDSSAVPGAVAGPVPCASAGGVVAGR